LNEKFKLKITFEGPTSPISCNNLNFLNNIETRIGFNYLAINIIFSKLYVFIPLKLNSINCYNQLIRHTIFDIVAKICFFTSILCLITVLIVREVFFESFEDNCLFFIHSLTEQNRDIHLCMISKHYLLLNASFLKGTTANKAISKVYFRLPHKLLNGSSIRFDLKLSHPTFFFWHYILNPLKLEPLPPDNKHLIMINFPHVKVHKVFHDGSGLVLLIGENEPEVQVLVSGELWMLGVWLGGHQVQRHKAH